MNPSKLKKKKLRLDKPNRLLIPGNKFEEEIFDSEEESRNMYVTKEDCEFQTLSKDKYNTVIYEYNTDIIDEFYEIYNRNKFFNGIDKKTIQLLANLSKKTTFPADTIVQRQGEAPMNQYFVKKGSLKILRKVSINDVENKDNLKANYLQIWKKLKSEIIFEQGAVEVGECFSTQEVMASTAYRNSILTIMPTELVYFSVYDLMRAINVSDVRTFKLNVERIITDFEQLEFHLKELSWDTYKVAQVKNCMHEKKLKRASNNPRQWHIPPKKNDAFMNIFKKKVAVHPKNFEETENHSKCSNSNEKYNVQNILHYDQSKSLQKPSSAQFSTLSNAKPKYKAFIDHREYIRDDTGTSRDLNNSATKQDDLIKLQDIEENDHKGFSPIKIIAKETSYHKRTKSNSISNSISRNKSNFESGQSSPKKNPIRDEKYDNTENDEPESQVQYYLSKYWDSMHQSSKNIQETGSPNLG